MPLYLLFDASWVRAKRKGSTCGRSCTSGAAARRLSGFFERYLAPRGPAGLMGQSAYLGNCQVELDRRTFRCTSSRLSLVRESAGSANRPRTYKNQPSPSDVAVALTGHEHCPNLPKLKEQFASPVNLQSTAVGTLGYLPSSYLSAI
jgi:hypothetical protein